MNHCYRIVFNAASQTWQAVAETAKSHGKSGKIKVLALASMLVAANVHADPALNALPTGGQVVAGQSAISQQGANLTVNQSTQKSIINWNSYDIGANATVNYVQPNASAISLNRVLSSDPSQIFGKLNANGQVWLINPNGILFGKGAQINVGGVLASTLNIADDDFLSGNYRFTGSTGNVTNQGSIVANNGGYVALLAPEVRNEGVISALEGASVLAAGDAVTMDFNGNGLINVQVDSANVNALIENKQLIQVGGGQVLMSTKAADNLMTSVINNSGRVEADAMVNDGGVIRLTGAKTVINSGEISAKSSAGKGGSVQMLGEHVGVFDAGSIDVNGKTGGGTILVGGDFQGKNAAIQNAKKTFISQNAKLSADATETGDGGKVIVWADDATRFYGNISAQGGAVSGNGGLVEVSGKNYLDFNGLANTSAAFGNAGTLLLDPTNITISTGVNTIESSGATTFQEASSGSSVLNTTTLQTALASNNVNVTTASPAGSAGNITVSNAVTWASGNSLTLTADNNIAINAGITTGTAASALILNAAGNVTQGAVGIIGGAGGVVKNGAGTFTANRANTYTGTLTINSGTVTMGASNVFDNASTIFVNGGTLNASNRSDTVAGVRLDSGAITGTSSGTLTSTTAYDLRSGTVSKRLGGSVGLNKTTTGTVTLSGANTYTGATNITAGTLIANNNAALGTVAGATTVSSGATLAIQGGRTISDALTISGDGVGGTEGALRNVSGNNTYKGAITIASGGARINSDAGRLTISGAGNITGAEPLTVSGAGNTTISKVIATGTGTLTKEGTGTLTLSGNNTYTGATNINAGTLALGGNDRISNTSAVTVDAGATFNLGNYNETIGSLTGAGTVTKTGGSTRTLTTGGNNTSTTFSGVIQNPTGKLNLTKKGTGIFTLSGANTYTGTTTIAAGTLSLVGGNAIADTSAVTLANVSSAKLDLNNTDETIGSLAGGGATGGNVVLGTATLATGGNNISTTFAGVMSGTGGITKLGTGTMTLSRSNTYTGLTTISAGTLAMGASNVFANASTILVNGGTLNASNRSDTVAGVRLDSGAIIGTSGTLTSTTAYDLRSGTVSKRLGGSVGLNKTTAGSVTLSGANTYTGATNIAAGTLVAANANALGTTAGGATVASGATLQVDNVTLAAEAITLNGNGVGGVGALQGTDSAAVNGAVTTASNSMIGTTSPASTLSLNGTVTAAHNVGIVGAGDVTAINAANNFSTVNITGAKNVNLRDTNAITLGGGVSSLTGNLTVQAGGNVAVANNVATSGGDITLAGTQFNNTAGAGALSASGRWLVYVNNHTGNAFGGLDSGNQAVWGTAYPTAVSATGNRYVFANSPVVTVTSTNQNKTYGQDGAPIVANAFSVTGFVDAAAFGNVFTQDTVANAVTGSATSTGSATTASVAGGPYAISVAPITATTGYTLIKNSTGNLTVNPAALTITANDQSKTYGQTFNFVGNEFTSSALQNGETIGSVTLASAGAASTANVAGGPYAITASNATGGTFDASNYSINYIDGSMTVSPAALTITANDQSKTYGQTFNFVGNEFTSSALQNGETIGSVTLTSAGAVNTANVAGGPYAITASNATGGSFDANNYTINYIDGSMTVNPATLTITANDQSKTYGQTFNFVGNEFTSSALQNGETVGSVSLASAGSVNTANVAGSTYAITASNATGGSFDASNYTINYIDGTMTVNRAPLSIVANNATKLQGAPNPAFSSTITGFVNGETSAVLIGTLDHSTLATAASPAGIYAITPFGVSADNYAISFVDGMLTVGRPTSSSLNLSVLNGSLTRPEQAEQTCGSDAGSGNDMINGLDAFGADDVEYRESVSQPLVGGVVANALTSPACLKL